MTETIRVFVAATPSEWLPMRVLEFSIREVTALPVEVRSLSSFERPMPVPKAKKNRPRTPFSFQRFLIPEMCGYEGKAIYLDSDMQVFQDIAKLWNQLLGGCDLQTVGEVGNKRPGQFSVMLLDCARFSWRIEDIVAALDSGDLDYEKLLYEMCVAKKIGRAIPSEWNSLEHYDSEATALLHYTDMHRQPWVSVENPLGNLWISCLRRALANGFISQAELEHEVLVGHVRPSLLVEVKQSSGQLVDLPNSLSQLDRGFVPPYKRHHLGRTSKWVSIQRLLGGIFRRVYSPSVFPKMFH